jgi:prophage antirepressor-like protein
MTPDLSLTNLFEGKEVHIIEYKNDVWIPINDLAVVWGIDRTTPLKIITRNMEIFDGMVSLIDWDVTSQTMGMHVNERGLYLLMGKISASRLKNKEAAKAIIRFQRWVPELIQKYRKKEIVQKSKEPDYEAALRAVRFAKELAVIVGTDSLPLFCQALDKHELSMYGGLLVVQKGALKGEPVLPALPKPKDYLTATDIGVRIGKSAHEVNMFLYQHKPPLLIKDLKGEWRLTEYGKNFGEERMYEVSGGYLMWRIKWKKDILEKFNIHVHEEMG